MKISNNTEVDGVVKAKPAVNSDELVTKSQLDAVVAGNGAGVSPSSRTTVGGETTWDLGYTIPNTLQLFANGTKLVRFVDYDFAGTLITFDPSYLPISAGEVQEVYPNISVVGTVGDDTISTAKIQDNAVTSDKMGVGEVKVQPFVITNPNIVVGEFIQEVLPAVVGTTYLIISVIAESGLSNPTNNLTMAVRYNGNTNNIVSGTVAFNFAGAGVYMRSPGTFINGTFSNTAIDIRLSEVTDETITGTITGYITYIEKT